MSAAEQLLEALIEKGMTISTAESCTGGMTAASITDLPGASACFETGFITYSNAAKMRLLGVNEATLVQYGAVSEQTVREMCEGARRVSGASIAVALTGIAGPGGGTADKPVGLVYIGVSGAQGTAAERLMFGGGRGEVRRRAAEYALEMALRYIEQLI